MSINRVHRNVRNKVSIHNIELNAVHAGVLKRFHVLSEGTEIRRQDRGDDLNWPGLAI